MFKWNDGTELYHHGIKGQKWGVRRFQNEDGSLTAAGRERYGVSLESGRRDREAASYRPGPKSVDGNGRFRPLNLSNRPASYSRESKGVAQPKKLTKYESSRWGKEHSDYADGKKYVNDKLRAYSSDNYKQYGSGKSARELHDWAWKAYGPQFQDEMLEVMSKDEYIKLMTEISALSELNFNLSKDDEYLRAPLKVRDAIHEEIKEREKAIERRFAEARAQSKIHKEKKKKDVDQKVQLN